MKEEYFCFNTDCIVYQAKQEARKANRQDLLDTFNRRLCKLCKESVQEKPKAKGIQGIYEEFNREK